jgi:hypothetical protein
MLESELAISQSPHEYEGFSSDWGLGLLDPEAPQVEI